MAATDEIWALFRRWGAERYGEDVTQEEHARQTAARAEAAGAPPALVVAALLHDIGHLLEAADRDATFGDPAHDGRGASWLAARGFGPEVTEPVRLHVAAKRYLSAVEPDYGSHLSTASAHTLAHQGGPFDEAAAARFAARPGADQAVALRRWDDDGKVEGLVVPHLDHFRPLVEAAAG